jgi:hypothetical protein
MSIFCAFLVDRQTWYSWLLRPLHTRKVPSSTLGVCNFLSAFFYISKFHNWIMLILDS